MTKIIRYVCPKNRDVTLYVERTRSNRSGMKRSAMAHRGAKIEVRQSYRRYISGSRSKTSSVRAMKSTRKLPERVRSTSDNGMYSGIPNPKKPRRCSKCKCYYYKWECIRVED